MSSILIVPDEIADLARRARSHHVGPGLPPESPSLIRSVLADWLEEQGDDWMCRFLRERPTGQHEELWTRERAWVLDAIIEAHEKRTALLDLRMANATAKENK